MRVTLELSVYDQSMLFGLVQLGRRYGDSQTFDWCGDIRDRLLSSLGMVDVEKDLAAKIADATAKRPTKRVTKNGQKEEHEVGKNE